MKKTPQLMEALVRLQSDPNFRYFVAELESYQAALTERLINADSERLQVAQGMCRAISSVTDIIKGK